MSQNGHSRFGIQFDNSLSWQEVVSKAKRENKFIFVDCFTTWCGPCKKMDEKVYSADSVGSFFNKKFISLKLQMDRVGGDNSYIQGWYKTALEFQKKYDISFYPTYLFFSPDGVIVHKAGSYVSVKEFMEIGKFATDSEKQYFVLLENYKRGVKSYLSMPYLWKTAKKFGDNVVADQILSDYVEYLSKLKEKELLNKETIEIIASSIKDSKSVFFHLFYPNGKKVNAIMHQSGYARRITDSIISREYIYPITQKYRNSMDERVWDSVKTEIKYKYGNDFASRNILWAKYVKYVKEDNLNMYVGNFIELVKMNGIDTTYKTSNAFYNFVAWNIFQHSSDTSQINMAIGWMKGVLRREANDPWYMDTYANLLYKVGRMEEAIAWQNKIINYGVREGNNGAIESGKFYIEKMRKNEPTWPLNKSEAK